jgi:hypothetical protein
MMAAPQVPPRNLGGCDRKVAAPVTAREALGKYLRRPFKLNRTRAFRTIARQGRVERLDLKTLGAR